MRLAAAAGSEPIEPARFRPARGSLGDGLNLRKVFSDRAARKGYVRRWRWGVTEATFGLAELCAGASRPQPVRLGVQDAEVRRRRRGRRRRVDSQIVPLSSQTKMRCFDTSAWR